MITSEKLKLMSDTLKSSSAITIREDLFIKWNLSIGQKYHLQCGDEYTFVEIIPDSSVEGMIMDAKLLEQLRIPTTYENVTLYFHESAKMLSIGLIVGLLTEVRETESGPHFGSIHDFAKELAVYCTQNHVLFYVFSLRAVHMDLLNIQGYTWNGETWQQCTVPTPHVVHNRIHSRKRERSESAESLFLNLKEKQIPFFNDHFLNKWETHQHLVQHEHLLPYLPETELLLTLDLLEKFVVTHDMVFIKPIHGSQGKKIIRIENKDNEYYLDYTTFQSDMEKKYDHIRDLFKAIRPRLAKQTSIIQQGIPLLTYEGRVLDFRFLCHMNHMNQWKVTSAVARISSPSEFVSNLARGGEIYKVGKVLKELLDTKTALDVNKMLHELALEVASSIGQSEEGLFGELGIDLALDHKGRPWIIEVNTKPSKDLDSTAPFLYVRPSAKAVIQYCLYLSNPFQRSEIT
ncbi:YheC/YheD family protein [Bacillus pinisoli]|uniref:YheC/YheD family endospore coat-associated protein n=1 Tax=Bacillus pinisoli TaxID=2901866 RepID=UPI001FF494A7|nr:YheC/YheD family protein [Bacillus pinisoli]